MRARFCLSDLVPPELAIESVSEEADTIVVSTRALTPHRPCPRCGAASDRVHSRYVRTVLDLPCSGRKVELRVATRRFVCTTTHCHQKIFAERFGEAILSSRARRTARLECLVQHLGIALGGRPAASFAKRLMLPDRRGGERCRAAIAARSP
jgi:transposase